MTIGDKIDRERTRRVIVKHYGPGDHASGTPQTTHGRGGRQSSTKDIRSATNQKGGVTIRTMSGERPEKGFAVAIPGLGKKIEKAEVSRGEIGLYLRENWDKLTPEGFFLGTWKDSENGTVWLDTVKVIDGDDYAKAFDEAVTFGKGHGELAIYDLLNGEEIALGDEQVIANYREGLGS